MNKPIAVYDNSADYVISTEPMVIYGIAVRVKGESRNKPIFIAFQTRSYSKAIEIIDDLRCGRRYVDSIITQIVLIKRSIEVSNVWNETYDNRRNKK